MLSPTATNPLASIATQKDRFIQFARGFSILTIVLFHYFRLAPLPYFMAKAVLLGGTGVHVFLFLSGYGLALSRYKSWGGFFKRRFVKVLVPYYVGIVLIFSINVWLRIYPDGIKELLSHLLLYKMFIEPYTRSFGGHFWFISTIIQFYLLFPLLIPLVERLGPIRSIMLAIAISLGYSLLIANMGNAGVRVWNSFFLQYLWEFVLGILIARNQLLPALLKRPWSVYLALAIFGIGVTAGLAVKGGQTGQIFNDYFAFIGYVAACVILYRIGNRARWLNRFVLWIESFSYSLYIMHMVPLSIYLKFFAQQSLTTGTIIAIFGSALGLALLFDYGIKRLMKTALFNTN
jgi:peptidoglycan/LPS O-acetylase OafA/YrhL